MEKIFNKKGVSEMIAYILLILIAVGIAVSVFAFLKLYIPKNETPGCQQGIAVSLQNYTCSVSGNPTISAGLYNNGLFNISGAKLKIAPEGQDVFFDISLHSLSPPLFEYVSKPGVLLPLAPGSSTTISGDIPSEFSSPGKYNLEVIPVEVENNNLAICQNAVFTQEITCN